MIGIAIKDPDDTLDYDVEFGRYLPDGDTVTSASAVAYPEDGTLVVESVSVSDNVVKVWVSGGDNPETYSVTVTATSAAGRQKDATFKLRMRSN